VSSGGSTSVPPSVILFDGVCNLCNTLVQFVIARDPEARFQFAALQSESGRRILRERGVGEPHPDSLVLVASTGVFVRSTAALRIARQLRPPWPLAYGLIAVPRPLRDWAYNLIANRRYEWFGRRQTCMIPTPDLRARFLDSIDSPAARPLR
jgi:predicted DCC family thiol-disulfide oxidoreductase YuxK